MNQLNRLKQICYISILFASYQHIPCLKETTREIVLGLNFRLPYMKRVMSKVTLY